MRSFFLLSLSLALILSISGRLALAGEATPEQAASGESVLKPATTEQAGTPGSGLGEEENVPRSALDSAFTPKRNFIQKMKASVERMRAASKHMKSKSQEAKAIRHALRDLEKEVKEPAASGAVNGAKRSLASLKVPVARLREKLGRLKTAVVTFEKGMVDKVKNTVRHASLLREVKEQTVTMQKEIEAREAELAHLAAEGEIEVTAPH